MAGRIQRIVLAIALAAIVAPAGAVAAARPDTSFGDAGYVTTQVKGTAALAYGATVTGDGKVVIAGQSDTKKGNGQVVVVRYRQNGRPDRDFAARGIFQSDLPGKKGPFIGTAVAEDGDGKLLVAGGYGQGSLLAMRLTKGGRVDRSFGSKGIATAAVGGIAQSMAIQHDGSILLGGSNANDNGRPMVVARFSPDGERDMTFGTGGSAQIMFWDPTLASSAGVNGLDAASDGTITGFGHLDYIGSDGHGSAGVFRLTSDGRPEPSFGTGGNVEVAFTRPAGGFGQWFPCGFGIDSQGRTTVTGDGTTGTDGEILTTRLTPAGVPDSTYGTTGDGRVVTPGAESDNDTTCGAAVDSAGNLTAGVGSVLAQLTPDGTPSDAFAAGGVLEVKKPKRVAINAVELAAKRRIVVAGSAGNSIYVGRFRP